MKRFPITTSCLGAALTLAASVAHAQTTVPNSPNWVPYVPASPGTSRVVPAPEPKKWRVFPPPASTNLDPAPRMAPMPSVEPIPNLAPGFGQDPTQRMAPMPGANGGIPGVPPRLVLPVVPRRFVVPDYHLHNFEFSPTAPSNAHNFEFSPTAPSTALRPGTMVADDDFLYILRGDTVVKIDKKTLAVVGSTTLPAATFFTAPSPMVQNGKSDALSPAIRQRFGLGPLF